MESTHVWRNTLYVRLHRNQTTVFTLGKILHTMTDEPLVEALDICQPQGESVTHTQGMAIVDKISRAKHVIEG